MVSALLACNVTLADISTVSNDVNTATWDPVGGNAPFYTTSLSGLTGQGFPGGSSDPYIVLSETFTITNGAGGLTGVTGQSNYMLNAISIIASGGNGPVQVHMYDVTTNLTSNNGSVYNGSGATYNFTANGDLFGGGSGLTFTNNLSGEQQEFLVLANGPRSQDQIILGTNHTYALELWVPSSESGNLIWFRSSNGDPGGQAMGSTAGSLAVPRITITSLGLAGGAPRTFCVALYGSATTASLSVNTNLNSGGNSNSNSNVLTYIVDNFSTNGVGPANPTNDDYYSTAQNYADGDITNVYWNWFGSGAFSNVVYAPGVSPAYAPSQGSLEIQLDWAGATGDQFELWNQGPTNDDYAMNLSALAYTNFQCDVMFAPGSATNASGNFGLLQFGNRPPNYGQDYFGGGNSGISVASANAGVWQHVSIALNPTSDTNLLTIDGLLLHIYDGSGTLNGPSTIYVDNIEFVGPLVTPPPPPAPTMSVQPAKPGLRMFVGSSATYVREGVITTQSSGESESWVGAGGSVSYSFQLLSYPPANIGGTELAILPEASFNTTANYQKTIYNNPFLDSQDSNGLYMTIAPHGGGSVTATVQWKIGLPNANPTNTVLTITNPTAIGTWTLTMNSATSGTLTAPGGMTGGFTITDATVTADFANPAVAVIAEDPNSSAGYGLYEDYGTISITGTGSGTQSENFANETSDFNNGTSPGGFFQNNYSVDPGNLVIVRKGLDAYWFNWNQDLQGTYNLITSTNILMPPGQWISPDYYSGYNIPDETAPRGVGVQHLPNWWALMPFDDLPTVDGNFQQNAPAIDDPLSPNAYFMLTTNTANIFPVIP